MKFYDERYNFVFLVGSKLEEKDKSKVYSETLEEGTRIALIPGKIVFKYFTEMSHIQE